METPPSTTTIKKPISFKDEDNGLASIAHFSSTTSYHNQHNIVNIINNYNNENGYFVDNENHMMRRRNSLRNISSLSPNMSPNTPTTTTTVVISGRSRFDDSLLYAPHFLESCSLCRKPLAGNRDIFMYRGDTPFCTEECRQEQIEMDEANEKNWKLKSLRAKKDANKNSTSKPQNYSFRTSTVAAA